MINHIMQSQPQEQINISVPNPIKLGVQTVGQPREQFNDIGLNSGAIMPTYFDSPRMVRTGILTSEVINPGEGNANRGEVTVARNARVTARIGAWNPSYQQNMPTDQVTPNPWSSTLDVNNTPNRNGIG